MSEQTPVRTTRAVQLTESREALGGRKQFLGGWRRRWNRMARWQQWLFLIIVLAAVYYLPVANPWLITTEPGNDFPIACFQMAVYALVAVGLNVVVGFAGLLDLGYIAFFAIGSYTAAFFTSPDSSLIHIPYLWTLPLALGIAMLFGVALGLPTLRLRGDYLAIVTLGFGEIIRILATIIPAARGQVGFKEVGHPPGTASDGQPIFSVSNGVPWYWLAVTVIIVILLLVGNLERSRVGRAWIAIREDEDAAEIMGVPTFKFKLWAFAIGAGVGGLSGALFAGQVGFVNNQKFDVATSMLFVAAVVLGGSGNKVGAILGGAIVAYIPLRFTAIADYKYLIFGIILIVLMIFRPQGLVAAKAHLLTYSRLALDKVSEFRAARVASEQEKAAAAEAAKGVPNE
ncbi:branched-chain amino acid ABC transporter permease [Humibacter sp. RRB41]|uniref:branched-chain amino acid ABC transporter permease n=1 Tax=Humibacter sp. RRB41 TaxID=2919946 RepID=UPI0035B3CA8D